MSEAHRRTALLDRFAILLSAVCLVHCLAIPLLVAMLPMFGSAFLSDSTFHWLLLVLVLPASIWALTSGCRRHRRFKVAAIGAMGLSILISVGIAGHELFGESGERLATSVGSAIVALAHLLNYNQLRASTSRGGN